MRRQVVKQNVKKKKKERKKSYQWHLNLERRIKGSNANLAHVHAKFTVPFSINTISSLNGFSLLGVSVFHEYTKSIHKNKPAVTVPEWQRAA